MRVIGALVSLDFVVNAMDWRGDDAPSRRRANYARFIRIMTRLRFSFVTYRSQFVTIKRRCSSEVREPGSWRAIFARACASGETIPKLLLLIINFAVRRYAKNSVFLKNSSLWSLFLSKTGEILIYDPYSLSTSDGDYVSQLTIWKSSWNIYSGEESAMQISARYSARMVLSYFCRAATRYS